jgi:UDP-N-acetylmuramyl tripeptide synthase
VFLLARASGRLSRLTRRGRGGTIPGRVTLALRRDALAELTSGRVVVLVSGTNGKTTTTRLLAAALAWRGPVVTNGDGANLLAGLVAALLPPSDRTAAAVLEVDERVLPAAIDVCRPDAVVLLNLSRDQLDRYEEVGSHVGRWSAALAGHPAVHVVANAADPLVVAAVRRGRPHEDRVTWVDAGSPWRADAPLCPMCGHAWDMRITPWACDSCGATMPRPAWRLRGVDELLDATGCAVPLRLSLPGRAGGANAVMAAATAHLMGIPVDAAIAQLGQVTEIDGRYATVIRSGRQVQLLLAKNPAGWLEILEQLGEAAGPLILGINARTADGTDPSWLWDVPFERLRGRRVVVYGDRALDLSIRLHYAEVAHDIAHDVVAALATGSGGAACVAANYTAFVAARDALHLVPA